MIKWFVPASLDKFSIKYWKKSYAFDFWHSSQEIVLNNILKPPLDRPYVWLGRGVESLINHFFIFFSVKTTST